MDNAGRHGPSRHIRCRNFYYRSLKCLRSPGTHLSPRCPFGNWLCLLIGTDAAMAERQSFGLKKNVLASSSLGRRGEHQFPSTEEGIYLSFLGRPELRRGLLMATETWDMPTVRSPQSRFCLFCSNDGWERVGFLNTFMFGLRNRLLLAVEVLLAIREGLCSSLGNQDVLFTILSTF